MKNFVLCLLAVSLMSACGSPFVPTPADTTPPANVTGLTAAPGDGRVTLSWTAPSDADFSSVEISGSGITTVTVTAGTTTRVIAGLVNGTTYTFTVKSVDATGNKSAGATATARPADTTPPGNVIALHATPGDGIVVLGWISPTDPDFASVEISASGMTTVAVPKGTTSWTISGLNNDTLYTFTVTSVDTSENRADGLIASATPKAGSFGAIIY